MTSEKDYLRIIEHGLPALPGKRNAIELRAAGEINALSEARGRMRMRE